MLTRRQIALGSIAMSFTPTFGWAQAYPSRPVRFIVGFPPGGLADIGARIIGQALSERLKQQFVVENRPGAATNIANEMVVRAAPDGYTLLALAASAFVNQAVYEKLNFNLRTDIALVAGMTTVPLVFVVNPSLPIKTVPELIAYAKANPGKFTMGSFGTATTSHVTGEMFKLMAGVNMVHVPYRGGAPMLVDIVAGQLNGGVDALASSIEHVKAGRVRIIAVCSKTRSAALPDVPSMHEFLPGFEANAWNAIAAPKNTPTAIITKLNSELNKAFEDQQVTKRITDLGAEPLVATPAELQKMMLDEITRWENVVKVANIKPE
jgi:tripartite-type tricarboxylate transporter receptor subunit TctC